MANGLKRRRKFCSKFAIYLKKAKFESYFKNIFTLRERNINRDFSPSSRAINYQARIFPAQ
jgi:hypothetical protein